MAITVNFIGAPCSGKTTTAAKLFAKLKDAGYHAEYVSEYARKYIAKLQFDHGGLNLKPADDHQQHIFWQQLNEEKVFEEQNVTIVSDSSPLNTLMYLTGTWNPSSDILKSVAFERGKVIYFFCHPVRFPIAQDPNRLHGIEASLRIHDSALELFDKLVPGLTDTFIHLTSPSSEERTAAAFAVVLKELHALTQDSD